ncbi:MAG: UbiA family prenyltransferase [Methanomassiliicoccales archaeon]|nr:MAG: UbiA family prenyltransferase [Methanomassiliicoccales archaeon]
MTGFMDYLKAYYRVCRLEYAPGEIPAIFTVLFLGSASVSRFFEPLVIEALFAFMLLYLSGFIINAIADKDIDKKYDTFKTSIPKSVDILGEKTLWAMIITHVGVAIALAFHISFMMGSIWPIALVLIGVFFGLGYSIKPFHFKVRGVWHAIALGSSAFFLPFIFLMFVVAEGITIPLFIFIIGFCFIHYGMEFGNQAIDYVEDKASDVKTPPVRWGMIPSIQIALFCVVIGIVVEASSLYFILLSRGSFTFIHPILTTEVVYVGLLAIIAAGYYIPTKGLWKMLITLKESETIEKGMPTLKKICNYAKWQTSGILGVTIVSAILFVGMIYGPVSTISQDETQGSNIFESNIKIASPPEVEFYENDGICRANISISVLNDDTLTVKRTLMIEVESWVANFPLKAEWTLLTQDLMPNQYWNISTQILAHDEDDTTIKVYIKQYDSYYKDFVRVGDPWIIPSKKDMYIFDTNIELFEDRIHDKKANITVTVFNQGFTRAIGDLEVVVDCYTSYWIFSDEESQKNNVTLHANEYWTPKLTVNVNELDLGEPIFVIKLFYMNKLVDDCTLFC